MYSKRFEKETFKEAVRENVRTLYRKNIAEASPQQIFQAVSYAVKDIIMDDWIATQKAYDEADAKAVYYMSMEFLMGRALGNNLINMTAYKEVKEALEEMDIDLNVVEDEEPDAALGNGKKEIRLSCAARNMQKKCASGEMYILTKIRRQEKISLYRKIMNPYLQSHMICRSWDTVIT